MLSFVAAEDEEDDRDIAIFEQDVSENLFRDVRRTASCEWVNEEVSTDE